jgi:hypothetical protein
MFKQLVVLSAAALMMSACGQPEQAAAPPPPPPPAPKSFMVFFDLNSANLTPQAQSTLTQAADAYKSSGSAGVGVTGHTDRSGPDAYNMDLSMRRANAAKDALARGGVPATAITVAARGESQPLVPTADGVIEPQNRRDEIVIGGVASSNDLAYCKEMSARYRRFLGQQQARHEVAEAMYQCDQGNTAAAIPVLEKALTDAKIALPPRA